MGYTAKAFTAIMIIASLAGHTTSHAQVSSKKQPSVQGSGGNSNAANSAGKQRGEGGARSSSKPEKARGVQADKERGNTGGQLHKASGAEVKTARNTAAHG